MSVNARPGAGSGRTPGLDAARGVSCQCPWAGPPRRWRPGRRRALSRLPAPARVTGNLEAANATRRQARGHRRGWQPATSTVKAAASADARRVGYSNLNWPFRLRSATSESPSRHLVPAACAAAEFKFSMPWRSPPSPSIRPLRTLTRPAPCAIRGHFHARASGPTTHHRGTRCAHRSSP